VVSRALMNQCGHFRYCCVVSRLSIHVNLTTKSQCVKCDTQNARACSFPYVRCEYSPISSSNVAPPSSSRSGKSKPVIACSRNKGAWDAGVNVKRSIHIIPVVTIMACTLCLRHCLGTGMIMFDIRFQRCSQRTATYSWKKEGENYQRRELKAIPHPIHHFVDSEKVP
jgi:hypothetical protein